MQVILQDDVPELGSAGNIVKVREGYARNFLFPKKLAVQASEQNLKLLEHQKKVISLRQDKLKQDAQVTAGKLKGVKLAFEREAGEEGRLFGSVTNKDVAAELTKQGVTIDRRRIVIPSVMKEVGEYEVLVRLHSEVQIKLPIIITAAGSASA